MYIDTIKKVHKFHQGVRMRSPWFNSIIREAIFQVVTILHTKLVMGQRWGNAGHLSEGLSTNSLSET